VTATTAHFLERSIIDFLPLPSPLAVANMKDSNFVIMNRVENQIGIAPDFPNARRRNIRLARDERKLAENSASVLF